MFLRAFPLKTSPNYGPFAKITTLAPDNYNRHTHPRPSHLHTPKLLKDPARRTIPLA